MWTRKPFLSWCLVEHLSYPTHLSPPFNLQSFALCQVRRKEKSAAPAAPGHNMLDEFGWAQGLPFVHRVPSCRFHLRTCCGREKRGQVPGAHPTFRMLCVAWDEWSAWWNNIWLQRKPLIYLWSLFKWHLPGLHHCPGASRHERGPNVAWPCQCWARVAGGDRSRWICTVAKAKQVPRCPISNLGHPGRWLQSCSAPKRWYQQLRTCNICKMHWKYL